MSPIGTAAKAACEVATVLGINQPGVAAQKEAWSRIKCDLCLVATRHKAVLGYPCAIRSSLGRSQIALQGLSIGIHKHMHFHRGDLSQTGKICSTARPWLLPVLPHSSNNRTSLCCSTFINSRDESEYQCPAALCWLVMKMPGSLFGVDLYLLWQWQIIK